MNEDLQKQANWFSKADKQFAEGVLIQAWNRGDRIRQIIENDGKYGDSPIERLADWLNVSNSSLYALRNFAVGYSKDEVKKLAAQQMSNGHHIELKHCQVVLRVAASEEKRAEIFERVFSNSLSASQLEDELAAEADKKSNRGGRKPSKPASVTGGLKGTDRVLTSLLNRSEIMEQDVYGKIEEMEPDRISGITLELLDNQLELLDESAKAVAEMRGQAEKARKRVVRVLEKKPKDEEAPAKKTAKKAAKKPDKKTTKKSGKAGKVVRGAKKSGKKTAAPKGKAKKKSNRPKR
jgi:hypothetical protein